MTEPRRQAAGAARHGAGTDAARLANARRTAWWLAGLAAFIFVGYLAWMYFRTQGGV